MHGRTGLLDTGWRLALAQVAVLAGTALQLQRAETGPAAAMPVALVSGTLLALAGLRWRAAGWGLPAALAGLLLAGFALTDLRASARLADALPPALEGRDLAVTGRIVGLPQETLTGTRFVFEVEQAPLGVPRRLSLAWFRGVDGDALLRAPPQALAPGQRWALTLRLKRPHGAMNPHGFDLELWLFERGLRAGGYVRASPATPPRLLAQGRGAVVDRARFALREAIQTRVADPRAAGVLAALVVGDQGAIDLENDIKDINC